MFKTTVINAFLYALLSLSASSAFGSEIKQEDNLVLRFTGPEARNLLSFLKERTRQEKDFDQTSYHGERMSLACNDRDDCYLWLFRKEWREDRKNDGASVLSFTLPLKQTTWSGQLSIKPDRAGTSSSINLLLEDRYFPGRFAFGSSLQCPIIRGADQPAPLRAEGDCRLELSRAPRKTFTYTPSVEFVGNLDNIVLNFKGPWARKLFTTAMSRELDPHDPKRSRARLGPELYCWNLDPLAQNSYLDDSYVCQANLKRQGDEDVQFTGVGSLEDNKELGLALKPIFRKGLLSDLDLHLELDGESRIITHCPNHAKNAGFGQCTVFHDMKIEVDHYPIGNSVQGVAVGWGITRQTR